MANVVSKPQPATVQVRNPDTGESFEGVGYPYYDREQGKGVIGFEVRASWFDLPPMLRSAIDPNNKYGHYRFLVPMRDIVAIDGKNPRGGALVTPLLEDDEDMTWT